jgi:hypothetical protein
MTGKGYMLKSGDLTTCLRCYSSKKQHAGYNFELTHDCTTW